MNASTHFDLLGFVKALFELCDWPDGGDIDGFDFQEAAIKFGLLVETTPLQPCGEECWCAEYHHFKDFASGAVRCYRKAGGLL